MANHNSSKMNASAPKRRPKNYILSAGVAVLGLICVHAMFNSFYQASSFLKVPKNENTIEDLPSSSRTVQEELPKSHDRLVDVVTAPSAQTFPEETSCAVTEHFRYRGTRLHKDIVRTNQFMLTEMLKYSSIKKTDTGNGDHCDPEHPIGQLIVGRWGGSEQEIMDYSELPTDTTHPIPSSYVNPGYYFLLPNESTFEEQRRVVQLWGKQRRDSYAVMNAFGVFDWDHRPDQIQGVEKYAPDTAWLHADAFYPPCFPTFGDPHIIYDTPWTEAMRNKTILIVHPFIDTIQQQIPRLPEIWSKVTMTGAPSSCMPIDAWNPAKFVRARLPVAHPTQTWLEVLQEMEQEIKDAGHFDVALISCGGSVYPCSPTLLLCPINLRESIWAELCSCFLGSMVRDGFLMKSGISIGMNSIPMPGRGLWTPTCSFLPLDSSKALLT
jgi:hypothetical protein